MVRMPNARGIDCGKAACLHDIDCAVYWKDQPSGRGSSSISGTLRTSKHADIAKIPAIYITVVTAWEQHVM